MVINNQDFDFYKTEIEQYVPLFCKQVNETKDLLREKLLTLEYGPATALGPAALTNVLIASHHKPGSSIVICTDGLANHGLGSFTEKNLDN